ncbi:MAG TPA: dihydroxyacetone kinase subunit DhaL [Lichenihabitans sp.]|nr:dihydroxyacetone kinase subunit DhaL [Lichenihabitans sp.]
MAEISSKDLIRTFRAVADAIEADRDRLCQLDGVIGDADHGVTMTIGFSAVTTALKGLDAATVDPTTVFNTAAKSFLNAVGASSGPLYATALMRAGSIVKGRPTLDRDAMVAVVAAMARGIQDRGKAERGDKTMLDAWLPAAEAAEAAAARNEGLKACLGAALSAASSGAEATKAMVASKGRASRLGARALGHMDPGAASAVTILKAFAELE